MKKRKDEVENSMNQSVNDDLKYQELLILAYLKAHYKKYEFNDIAQIMGMTYVEMRDCIEHLLELNYLLCIDDINNLYVDLHIHMQVDVQVTGKFMHVRRVRG